MIKFVQSCLKKNLQFLHQPDNEFVEILKKSMVRSPICISLTYHENYNGKSSQILSVETAVIPTHLQIFNYYITLNDELSEYHD